MILCVGGCSSVGVDTPEKVLNRSEIKAIANAKMVLSNFFPHGIVMITFERKGKTETCHFKWGNDLAVQKLVELYSADLIAGEEDEDASTNEGDDESRRVN